MANFAMFGKWHQSLKPFDNMLPLNFFPLREFSPEVLDDQRKLKSPEK